MLRLPTLTSGTTSRNFLKDLVKLNLEGQSFGSMRQLSMAVGWPASYISDVINGHKRLSDFRASQLTKRLGVAGLQRDLIMALVTGAPKEPKSKVHLPDTNGSGLLVGLSIEDLKLLAAIDGQLVEPKMTRAQKNMPKDLEQALHERIERLQLRGLLHQRDHHWHLTIDKADLIINRTDKVSMALAIPSEMIGEVMLRLKEILASIRAAQLGTTQETDASQVIFTFEANVERQKKPSGH